LSDAKVKVVMDVLGNKYIAATALLQEFWVNYRIEERKPGEMA